jgi:hypothetical protein
MRSFSFAILLMAFGVGCDGSLELGTDDGGRVDAEHSVSKPDADSAPARVTVDGATTPSGSTGAPDGGSSPVTPDADSVTPTECAITCETTAANGCDDNDLTAIDNQCVTFCARRPTAAQMTCLQATPCETLLMALQADGPLCGVPVVSSLLCYTYGEGCVCYYDSQPPEPADTATCTAASIPAADGAPNNCCADMGYATVAGTSCVCTTGGIPCASEQASVSSCTR